ncbi:MAG: hypothetical protein V7K48_18395 [Nostoc sp.]|uniref:hypothetical protein n=1 Tax=Nostoc sp. TaxID=1180 RepID=UPI002FF95B3D
MAVEHKNAAGTFPDRQHLETALSQLKAASFPMHNVCVVAQHGDSNEATLNPSEPTVQSEAQFARHRTIERIEHGALDAGGWGGVVGILGAELVTLAVPGVGSIVLAAEAASVGLATGTFYGAVAGAILGGAIGTNISDKQIKRYRERLAQGEYLIVIKGTNDEIHQAETVLKTQGVQDWIIFDTL